jgi:hypothetical protein
MEASATTAGDRIMARRTLTLLHPCPGRRFEHAGARLNPGVGPASRSHRGDRRRSCGPFAPVFAGLALAFVGVPALAQPASPNQPLAIKGLPPEPCPLLVSGSDPALQPLRIQPSQVPRKNAVGCLSPADAAVYGADGCPVKLCQAPQGTMPLPQF